MMYEDEADTLRGYQRALFKGSPAEQPEAHAKSSPITYLRPYNILVYAIFVCRICIIV